ncbi:hypothetical protein AAVH_20990 [Aphelenchoides avenae]|nr:hypothetical protein AAVH_20990 [Aphelenchus avenae]
MSSDPRKRAAGDVLASGGPVGKKSMPAGNAGQGPKEEPRDDSQEGQSQNSGMPSTAQMNNSGPTNARNNEDGSAEDRKIAEYTKQIETLQSDLTKLRHDQKKKDKATAAKEEELNKKLTAQIGVKEHLEKKVEELTKKIDELERRPAAGEGDQENVHQPQAEQAAQEMKRLRQELREAKKKAEDAEKKRAEAAQDAERYERQAEEAEQRVREQEEEVVYRGGEMARLQTEVDQLKVKLQQATEGRERRQAALEAAARNVVQQQWDADREKLLKQIEKLKREVAAYKQQNRIMNEEEAPDDILTAKLDCTMELYEIVKMLKGMTRHLPLKFDQNGLSIMTVQPRPTVPVVILKLNADFFDAYECRKGFARRVEYKRLLKALKFSREDECEMSHQQGSSEICFEFENNDTGESNRAMSR